MSNKARIAKLEAQLSIKAGEQLPLDPELMAWRAVMKSEGSRAEVELIDDYTEKRISYAEYCKLSSAPLAHDLLDFLGSI